MGGGKILAMAGEESADTDHRGEGCLKGEETMGDLTIALAFVAMVLSPCVVALIRLPEIEQADTAEMSEGDVLSRLR